jgi:hypothetical protein
MALARGGDGTGPRRGWHCTDSQGLRRSLQAPAVGEPKRAVHGRRARVRASTPTLTSVRVLKSTAPTVQYLAPRLASCNMQPATRVTATYIIPPLAPCAERTRNTARVATQARLVAPACRRSSAGRRFRVHAAARGIQRATPRRRRGGARGRSIHAAATERGRGGWRRRRRRHVHLGVRLP